MLESLTNFIISLIQQSGYAGVFVLMTLESALLPIPSEVTMPFAGSLINSGLFNFWLLVIVGTLANLTGSLLAYGLGYLGEVQVLNFIRRYGKYVFIREKEFIHAQKLFDSHGEIIIFASRILPAIRTYISLPAGIARMNLTKFIVYTVIGSLIWSVVLTYFGLILGNNWHRITPFFHLLDVAVIGGAVILLCYFLYKKFSSKRIS